MFFNDSWIAPESLIEDFLKINDSQQIMAKYIEPKNSNELQRAKIEIKNIFKRKINELTEKIDVNIEKEDIKTLKLIFKNITDQCCDETYEINKNIKFLEVILRANFLFNTNLNKNISNILIALILISNDSNFLNKFIAPNPLLKEFFLRNGDKSIFIGNEEIKFHSHIIFNKIPFLKDLFFSNTEIDFNYCSTACLNVLLNVIYFQECNVPIKEIPEIRNIAKMWGIEEALLSKLDYQICLNLKNNSDLIPPSELINLYEKCSDSKMIKEQLITCGCNYFLSNTEDKEIQIFFELINKDVDDHPELIFFCACEVKNQKNHINLLKEKFTGFFQQYFKNFQRYNNDNDSKIYFELSKFDMKKRKEIRISENQNFSLNHENFELLEHLSIHLSNISKGGQTREVKSNITNCLNKAVKLKQLTLGVWHQDLDLDFSEIKIPTLETLLIRGEFFSGGDSPGLLMRYSSELRREVRVDYNDLIELLENAPEIKSIGLGNISFIEKDGYSAKDFQSQFLLKLAKICPNLENLYLDDLDNFFYSTLLKHPSNTLKQFTNLKKIFLKIINRPTLKNDSLKYHGNDSEVFGIKFFDVDSLEFRKIFQGEFKLPKTIFFPLLT